MTRRTLLVLVCILASLPLHAAAATNFSGTWRLAKEKSKGLPRMFDAVTESVLLVTQDTAAINIHVTIDAEGRPRFEDTFVYPLDGSVRTAESTVHTPAGPLKVPTSLSSRECGDALELTESRTVMLGGKNDTFTSVERWSLSSDGATLTVHRKDQRPQGTSEYDMIFEKSP